jgi:hypothetical protein
MKNKILKLTILGLTALPSASYAADTAQSGADTARPNGVPGFLFVTPAGNQGIFGLIADTLIFLTGAIAVIVIIYGGLRYVTSTGDAARVKGAKDTILYGVVGLVVAILAYALVAFVVGSLSPGGAPPVQPVK